MRVCVLSDEVIEDFNPGYFLQGYEWEMVTVKAPVMEFIKAVSDQNRFDVYLNICEGYDLDGVGYEYYYASEPETRQEVKGMFEGVEVIRALEALNLAYTGANERFFDPTRETMQMTAEKNGIGFAKGYQVKSVEEAEMLVKNLRYPIIVKHPKSYGSTGMLKESRADTLDEVKTQVERICAEFGAARMEEFIIGREFNVFVVDNPNDFSDPFVYPPMEVIFPDGEEFWHVDVKWDYSLPLEFRQVVEEPLVSRLQDMTRRLFLALHGVGYGRCDIRMNDQGELFVLEINPNGGIMYMPEEFGPTDYMILYDKDGYKGFFDRIFKSAIIRQKARAEAGY
jgi:D-alanine-D-alanine ligase-like ATP-grasp enzyme